MNFVGFSPKLFFQLSWFVIFLFSFGFVQAMEKAIEKDCASIDDIPLLQRQVKFKNAQTQQIQNISLFNAALKSGVNSIALKKAFQWFDSNRSKIANSRFLTLIDYSKPSNEPRLYAINLCRGTFRKLQVAHGSGSDRNHNLYAEKFSNQIGSYASSLGFFITLDSYFSYQFQSQSLRLKGVSETNSNAYNRAIVMHGAGYVTEEWAECAGSKECAIKKMQAQRMSYLDPKTQQSLKEKKIDKKFDELVQEGRIHWEKLIVPKDVVIGRSQGCPALHPIAAQYLIPLIKEGSVIYAFFSHVEK